MPLPPASGDLNSHPTALRLKVIAHVSEVVIVLHLYTKSEFVGLPIPEIWLIFGHGVNWSGDLIFDLSTSKCGHLTSCQILAAYVLPFSHRHRMDRQTDNSHQCIMPSPYGGSGITNTSEHGKMD